MHVLRLVTGVLLFEAASGITAWFLGESYAAQSLVLVHTVAGLFSIPYYRSFFVHIGYERESRKLIRKLLGKLALLLAFVMAGTGIALAYQAAMGPRISDWLHYTHLVGGMVLGVALLLHIVRMVDRLRLPDRTAPTPEMPGGRFYAYLGVVAALALVTGILALAFPPAKPASSSDPLYLGKVAPPPGYLFEGQSGRVRVFVNGFVRRAVGGRQ